MENTEVSTSLTSIFNGSEEQPSQAQEVQDTVPAGTEAEPAATGEADIAQEAEQQVEPPATGTNAHGQNAMTEKERAAFKAVQDERAKRQKLEEQIQYLQRQQEEYLKSTQTQQLQDTGPDPFLEPEAYYRQQEDRLLANVNNQMITTRATMSQELMRSMVSDYDEVVAHFVEAADQNPHLWQQAEKHANPARFAYDQGKTLKFQKEMGNPQEYEAKLRAKILEELKAEQAKQAKATASAQKPTSLAGVPSAAGRKEPEWSGPTPLTDIFRE